MEKLKGRKCSKCGVIFTTKEDVFAWTCPDCLPPSGESNSTVRFKTEWRDIIEHAKTIA